MTRIFCTLLIFLSCITLTAQNQKDVKRQKDDFFNKAKLVGLSQPKAEALYSITLQRNKVLSSIKDSRKKSNHPMSIIEVPSSRVVAVTQKEFHTKVVELLSLKEYSDFSKDAIEPYVDVQTEIKLKQLLKNYDFTSKELNEVKQSVRDYYSKKILNMAYYKYDKKKLRGKLGVLELYFKKDFIKTMESFNKSFNNGKAKNINDYEW
ncbi:MAG: hypothetical protein ABJK28_10425 [Algibacter sp.]